MPANLYLLLWILVGIAAFVAGAFVIVTIVDRFRKLSAHNRHLTKLLQGHTLTAVEEKSFDEGESLIALTYSDGSTNEVRCYGVPDWAIAA